MTVNQLTSSSGTGVVTSQGIGSGIDVATLVSSLVSAAITPQQTLLQYQETTDQATISALGALQSSLAGLQSAADTISTGGALSQMTASSSNNSVFTATAGTGAVAGSYQVQVQTLAQNNILQSTVFSGQNAAVPTGTYAFNVGSNTFSVNIDSSNDTLSGLASAINGASGNAGVSATVISGTGGSYLMLSATQTGTANAVSVSSSPVSFNSFQSAADATGTIDNVPFDSASNIVSSALSNVTLNLTGVSSSTGTPPTYTPSTLTVGANTTSAVSAVQAFVSAYNSTLQLLNTDTAYTPSTTSANTGTAGPLLGDVEVQLLSSSLQKLVGGSINSTNAYTTLSQIGVTVNSDGTLALNSSTLTNALEQNPTAVQNLFSGSNGIGTQLDTLVIDTAGGAGTLATEITGLQTNVTNLTTQLNNLNTESTQLTTQYNAEFNSMDAIVQQYKNTANLLTSFVQQSLAASSSSSSSSSGG